MTALFNQIDSITSALGTPFSGGLRYVVNLSPGRTLILTRTGDLATVRIVDMMNLTKTPVFYMIKGQTPDLYRAGAWEMEVEREYAGLVWQFEDDQQQGRSEFWSITVYGRAI